MSTSYVHELMLVVARLPNRVLANLALPSRVYGYFSVARTPDIVWLPSLYLNNQQAYAGNAHNEIWISVSDQWFVVDNHVIWELLKKRKHFLLASAGAVGKAIWYHFSHVHPRGQSWHAGRAIAETNAAGYSFRQCAAVHAALPLTTLFYRRKYVSASIPPFERPSRLV